jgi:hypothetical protein
MGILRILTKIRDPLGELPSREEHRQRGQFEAIRQRIRTLESAQRAVGGVEQELQDAKQELSEASRQLPRGHFRGFIALCIWFVGTLTPLVVTSAHLQTILVDVWGSPEHWYLPQLPPFAVGIWRVWQVLALSIWSAALPVVVLALVWAGQRRLPRWHSRTLIKAIAAVETLFVLVVACSLFRLLSGPLS